MKMTKLKKINLSPYFKLVKLQLFKNTANTSKNTNKIQLL